MSKVPQALKTKLLNLSVALAMAASGATVGYLHAPTEQAQAVSAEVLLAMEIGKHYESSGRHIGTPYIDRIGKGQPWTVCNGVTGPAVVPDKYYTEAECYALELPIYQAAERAAQRMFTHWGSYNMWVRASIIDMIYNLGEGAVRDSTLRRLANAGDLAGACAQMPRWVMGTVNGRKTRLPGLVDRRATTAELCADWGRDGHFSVAEVIE